MTEIEPGTVADKELQKRLVFAWLDALRSGQWKQTRMRLEDKTGNCCLGIACRLYQLNGGELKSKTDGGGTVIFGNSPDDENWAGLPANVGAALGLVDALGQYGADVKDALYNDNDTGATFPDIANIIEREAKSLFTNGAEVATWIADRKSQQTT